MGEVINLNKVRKAREKAAATADAAGNRAKHGRTKVERALDQSKAEKAEAHLTGHQRMRAGDEDEQT